MLKTDFESYKSNCKFFDFWNSFCLSMLLEKRYGQILSNDWLGWKSSWFFCINLTNHSKKGPLRKNTAEKRKKDFLHDFSNVLKTVFLVVIFLDLIFIYDYFCICPPLFRTIMYFILKASEIGRSWREQFSYVYKNSTYVATWRKIVCICFYNYL